MYFEVDFPLNADQRLRLLGREEGGAHEFRKSVARGATALGSTAIPIHPLMHYSATGTPLDGKAPVWFSTYRGGVRITGVGQHGVGLVTAGLATLHKIIATAAGGIVPMIPRSGDCTIGLSHPRTYVVGTFAFVYKHRKAAWWKRLDEAKKDPAAFLDLPGVRDELARVSGRWLLISVPLEPVFRGICALTVEVSLEELERRLIIRVESARRILFLEEGKGRTLALKGVEITTNADLKGPWAIGRFASRGNGLLRQPISGEVEMQEAA